MDYKPYVDKYFLRAKKVLEDNDLNPYVLAQVFLRSSEGYLISGINEAIEFIRENSSLMNDPDSRIYRVNDKAARRYKEPVIHILARIQDIIDLETVYLGMISHGTTEINHLINKDMS